MTGLSSWHVISMPKSSKTWSKIAKNWEGQWWQAGTKEHEISIEEDFGRELGVKMGDELSFDIAGEAVSAKVTSFRTVEWDTFKPNFFMVFSPAALEGFGRADKKYAIKEKKKEF